MTEKQPVRKRKQKDPERRRMENLFYAFLDQLEEFAADPLLFHRRIVVRAREEPTEINTEGMDLDQMKVYASVLQETEKLRKSLFLLPGWEGREKVRLEEQKLALMEKKLSGADRENACGIIFMPSPGQEDEDAPEVSQ